MDDDKAVVEEGEIHDDDNDVNKGMKWLSFLCDIYCFLKQVTEVYALCTFGKYLRWTRSYFIVPNSTQICLCITYTYFEKYPMKGKS